MSVPALRRGTVVTVASPGVYYDKLRPAVVVQADRWLQAHPSATLCPLTSTLLEAPSAWWWGNRSPSCCSSWIWRCGVGWNSPD